MGDPLRASNGAPKVLIVDDDPAIVRFLADRCAKMGFEVQTATNGLQALIMAKQSHPNVLIVDINMPEVDGMSVAARLLGPNRENIEVVVVTGRSNPEAVERCDSFGAFHIRKGPDLWDRVQSALIELYPGMRQGGATAAAAPSRAEVRERPRVLLVDDDLDLMTFLGSRLRKYGVDTLFASDGTQAYRIACREEPSVIVTNYSMANGDAHYLLWRLRGTPATENTPVLVMSGRDLGESMELNLKRDVLDRPGAAQIFKKPIDAEELLAALKKYCAFEPCPAE